MNEYESQPKCRPIEKPVRKAIKWQRGQSLAEAAISLTLLIILFSGVIDLGRAFYVKIALDAAVGEGSHYAAIFPNCVQTANQVDGATSCSGTNSIWGRIVNENKDLASSQMGQVTITDISTGNTDVTDSATIPSSDDTIEIKASYDVNMLTPFIQAAFGKSLTIESSVKQTVRSSGSPSYNGKSLGQQPTGVDCVFATNTFTWTKPTTSTSISQYNFVDATTGESLGSVSGYSTQTYNYPNVNPVLNTTHTYYMYAATSSGTRVGYISAKVKCD